MSNIDTIRKSFVFEQAQSKEAFLKQDTAQASQENLIIHQDKSLNQNVRSKAIVE